MTRQEYDQILDAFVLGEIEFEGMRDENWEFFKTENPDELLVQLSYAVLRAATNCMSEPVLERFNVGSDKPRPEELN